MAKGTLLVVGAGGDVGRGIVAAALQSGRRVVAAGRDPAKLQDLGGNIATVAGDISTEAGAARLWDEASAAFGGISDAVISVNAASRVQPLADWGAGELGDVLGANVLTHFVAAKSFLPRMPESGMLIGIGGGTADFLFPGLAHVSIGQAALRMLYRGLAKERKAGGQLRELIVVSMVAGQSNRASARPDWLTDAEVGRHVCAVLDEPDRFAKPVLYLRSREQVGQPEAEPA
jgi:NAD(P)-dependent dehydrogenase (short-subunit alcohol dehydrogenase family)